MSIRPVDYTSLVSKAQEVSKVKQIENDKPKVQAEQGLVQQERRIKQDISKVRDTNKTENSTIDTNKRNKNNKNQYKRKQDDGDEEKKKDNIDNDSIGGTIDIRI
ncbi:hypothetical protein [Clostridium sp. Cult3]|uniref:hypothetical protein n=1 Tax=Clostridium sp. Cult3 TaxID=2079004 RepID=UPI001F21C8AD|nr:hypothetical protein [Clostridium sp. Cult3]MCF6460517.1 hypothetical protein [Clostridium sp. Cult3]